MFRLDAVRTGYTLYKRTTTDALIFTITPEGTLHATPLNFPDPDALVNTMLNGTITETKKSGSPPRQ